MVESNVKGKVITFDQLKHINSELLKTKKTVLYRGDFEFIHPGFIRFLIDAKKTGDVLIIIIPSDHLHFSNANNSVFDEIMRAEMVAAVECIDYVVINTEKDSSKIITQIKPFSYFRSSNGASVDSDEHQVYLSEKYAVELTNGKFFTYEDMSFVTKSMVNEIFSVFPPEVETYLREFSTKYNFEKVNKALDSFKSCKVLVLGEAILDEYVYGNTLGKSGKEPILALRYDSMEVHAGGSVVIANHLSEFCNTVGLVTYLGTENTNEEFIRNNLQANVTADFIYKSNSPTITKRRFVEKYLVSKLLELYEMNDSPLIENEELKLFNILSERLEEADVVIVADYGHGLISEKIIDLLCKKSKFLAINTQINAGNNGFHTVSRYPRADYVCVHEGEIRLDQRNRFGDIEPMVIALCNQMGAKTVMVTRGKNGTLLYDPKTGFTKSPALSIKVVDRVGAGDSVLAVSSLCVSRGIPNDLVGFISNMVGAQAITIVGNRTHINKPKLLQSICSVLKR